MNLNLDESQTILSNTFADFFSKECPPGLVRATEAEGFSPVLWQRFSEMGAPCMGLPESAQGLDLGLLELCLVAAAAGNVLAPLPFAEVASAGRLIAPYLNDAVLQEKIATGSEIISLVDSRNAGLGGGTTGGVERGDTDSKQWIPYGAVASHVVTLEGSALVLYSATGSHRPVVRNLGSGAHAFWTLADNEETDRIVLAQGPEIEQAFTLAIAEWKLITAAALAGLSQQALAVGVEYAKTREQFGTVIGAFQAIAHPLADCAMRVDGAELLVWEAAWASEAEPERFQALCSMALVFAAQTAQETSSVSLHTHGGYGFTEEYDIQMYYRRACAWSMMVGGIRSELRHLTALRSTAVTTIAEVS